MTHIFVCKCHHEFEVEPKAFDVGNVIECPACGKVFGCVRSRMGPKSWVEISHSDVEFLGLLDEYDPVSDEVVAWKRKPQECG